MADDDLTAEEDERPEDPPLADPQADNQKEIIDVTPSPPISAADGDISFPIEGESKWVTLMRILAFATLAGILVIAAVFHFLAGDDSFVETQQLGMMLGGIVFLLVLEYFIFLRVVIPRQADYGRYVLTQDQVEFYPLTALGLGVGQRKETVNMSRFMGITTRPMAEKKGKYSYAVYLVHTSNKGKTINLQNFPAAADAERYAVKMGRALRLNVASGIKAKHKRAQ